MRPPEHPQHQHALQDASRRRKMDLHVHFGNIHSSDSEVEDPREQSIVPSMANDARAVGADSRQQPPAQPRNLGRSMAAPAVTSLVTERLRDAACPAVTELPSTANSSVSSFSSSDSSFGQQQLDEQLQQQQLQQTWSMLSDMQQQHQFDHPNQQKASARPRCPRHGAVQLRMRHVLPRPRGDGGSQRKYTNDITTEGWRQNPPQLPQRSQRPHLAQQLSTEQPVPQPQP